MAYNSGDYDPFQQFKDGDVMATPDEINFLLGIANGLKEWAPYEIQYEVGFRDPLEDGCLMLTAAEAHDNDEVSLGSRVGIGGERFANTYPLLLVYDDKNRLVYISPDGQGNRARSAKLAIPIIENVIEQAQFSAPDELGVVLAGLLKTAQSFRARKNLIASQPHPATLIHEVIKDTAKRMGVDPVREASTDTVLDDFSSVRILFRDYLFVEVPDDFDPSRQVRLQIDLEDPATGRVTSFLEYHDGSTYCDVPYPDDDGEEEDGIVLEAMRESGIYRPQRSDVERLTDALVEFSLKETLSD